MKKHVFFLTIFVFVHAFCTAQLRIPNVLSDNMVLQRNTDANIWGWGYASTTVSITASWMKDTIRTQVDGTGRWMTQLPTSEAGGPYEINIESNGHEIRLNNVLLGDVWLCSGQSNMEWGGNQKLPEIMEELPYANDSKIRLLQVRKNGSDFPQDDILDTWQTLDSNSLRTFSAIGYFVAKNLRAELDVPIGIINSSWGGTPAEVWTPSFMIENDPLLKESAGRLSSSVHWPHRPATLWNSMIAPLTRFAISGAYWYQGESNVGTWYSYDKLMRSMVSSWRMAWNRELPFYFVQIAPFAYNNEVPLAALLREQQAKTADLLPNAAMVVITDLVDDIKDIHPIQKKEVAARLAKITLNDHYKVRQDNDYKSPIYDAFSIKGNTIAVSFKYLEEGLIVKGDGITDLYIAGEDKVFHAAKGVVKGNVLEVSSPAVKNPVAVRFGFSETAMPNLFNKKGLPVSPFRTDTWAF